MNKFCRKVLFCSILVFSFAFAEEAENVEENEITLPDVSTVIYGGAIKVGKSAVPDYSQILASDEKDSEVLKIELPYSENQNENTLKAEALKVDREKSIFAEGTFGAGFPGFFLGNFSIYRQGKNPFNLNFFHESSSGFAGLPLTSGYFENATEISGNKDLNFEKAALSFSLAYKDLSDGLQNKSEKMSDLTKNSIDGKFSLNWSLSENFYLNFKTDVSWFNRYGLLFKSESEDFFKALKSISVFSVSPSLDLGWKNSIVDVCFSSSYLSQADLNGSFDNNSFHRGDFTLSFDSEFSFVRFFADAGIVVGNYLGSNNFTVPFKAGADFSVLTPVSPRKLLISFAGGMESEAQTVSMLELKYKFSSLEDFQGECSSWFGLLDISFPIKNLFTVFFESTFKKTAFSNGIAEPFFTLPEDELSLRYGLYPFKIEDLTQINTNAGFSFLYKNFTLSLFWKSFWLDVPSLEFRNTVNASFSFQTENSKFGFEGLSAFLFDEGKDICPVVDFSVFFRITNALRLAVNANDIVKLVSGSKREYAGLYAKRGGNVSLVVKFNF